MMSVLMGAGGVFYATGRAMPYDLED
jgi:hypothetical protein